MRDFKKQRSATHEVFNFFVLCLGLLMVLTLLIFAAQAAWGMYVKFTVASRGDEAAQGELKQLKEQYARVSSAVVNLTTTRGEEGEIRERFGVGLPGEGAIQIVRSATSSAGAQNLNQENFLSKILRALVVW
jgi:Tfp pilus assembly protein PilO